MLTYSPETRGMVFDIEEFAVYDGPGIRCCVFLKGCPLRCMWCHNPEGLSAVPQRCVTKSLCLHCDTCRHVCPTPDHCTACGRCAAACPAGAIRIVGKSMTARETADRLRPLLPLLKKNEGGITFSGGEVMMQPAFVLAVRSLLPEAHALIETSAYAKSDVFRQVASAMDMVIMDVKLADAEMHRRYTRVDNGSILKNLAWLKKSGIRFRIRIPLIPGVTDTTENLEATAGLLEDSVNLEKVELLRYNKNAFAKYDGLGMSYAPDFDGSREPNADVSVFQRHGLPVGIL